MQSTSSELTALVWLRGDAIPEKDFDTGVKSLPQGCIPGEC